MKLKWSLILVVFFAFVSLSHAEVKDSIGVEKKDGKRYVLHKVEASETLWGLAKKYKVSVDAIKTANSTALAKGIQVGQVLRIPKEEAGASAVKPNTNTTTDKAIIHTVVPGETFYSIAKKYNVSVESLKKANPNLDANLAIGDEVKVIGATTVTNTANASDTPATHTVQKGETVYSISKKYGVSVTDLKKYNKDLDKGINVGQTIALKPEAASNNQIVETEKVINNSVTTEKKPEVEPKVMKDLAASSSNDSILSKDQEVEKKYLDSMSNTKVTQSGNYKKYTETGFAEVIEGGDTDKYLGLHKTAPVGTIIQVTNDANNQKIFVRIIGKLPSSGLNDKVVLKISKKAFERLAGVDKKIPVTLSYIM